MLNYIIQSTPLNTFFSTLSILQTKQIVKTCKSYASFFGGCGVLQTQGVISWGLKALSLWKIVVIHIPLLGKLNYLYVTIDTSSGLLTATPMVGEKTNHVIQHMLKCIVTKCFPHNVTAHNGSDYTFKMFAVFCAK